VIFISAKYRQHLFQLLDISLKLADDYKRRIDTSKLNKSLEKAILKHPIPLHMGRQAKMYFITQIDNSPPTFLISCSHPKDIHFSYRRYLANFFRLDLKLPFMPIRLILKDKSQRISGKT
jgi:GTP-binding protein